ncbi:MAG TPA: hypothetical protein VJ600_07230 [Holophagaceae bacterium]|nr:hypothetical protein [Holophagaceae bacterium]
MGKDEGGGCAPLSASEIRPEWKQSGHYSLIQDEIAMNIRPSTLVPGVTIAILLTSFGCKKEPNPCIEETKTSISPSGKYEARLTVKTCAWGFGMAAESVEVKITKLGQGGWFYIQPIEFDSINKDDGCPLPSITWTGPNELTIHALTRDTSGRVVRQDEDLSVIREYVLQNKSATAK